jgi:membrane protease YdiL (CAAX protease family)
MKHLTPLKWADYLWLYGVPTLLNFLACQLAIPYLQANSTLPIEVIYFISVGGIALAPMFFLALIAAKRESRKGTLNSILKRMRIKKMNGRDWLWTVGTFVVLCATSFVIAKVIMPQMGIDATPFFFKNMPLDADHMWILYVWPAFFFFNIFGEEFLWRGYIQPRQELQLGRWTWLVHGLYWAAWHLPMGLDLIFAATPIFFILPAVVQLRQNTTIAIVVHAVFGAFGFLALSLGGVH